MLLDLARHIDIIHLLDRHGRIARRKNLAARDLAIRDEAVDGAHDRRVRNLLLRVGERRLRRLEVALGDEHLRARGVELLHGDRPLRIKLGLTVVRRRVIVILHARLPHG